MNATSAKKSRSGDLLKSVSLPKKLVFSFGARKAEGRGDQKELLGGKGAGLHEMTQMGLPVPAGFTVITDVCRAYYQNSKQVPKILENQVVLAMKQLEKTMRKKFGDPKDPLLVSVRSGARASMPGMMDTILNLGLNETTVQALARKTGDERFALDSYRRFIQMYSDVVLNVHVSLFESELEGLKHERGVELDHELSIEDLRLCITRYDRLLRAQGVHFPTDPYEQLWGAIRAVFESWMSARAITYRKIHAIPEDWGTAVTVQAMVFGNMGDTSATGVAFTRDPSTGERIFFGEFLVNAQGEDVVAGIRTPLPLNHASRGEGQSNVPTLQDIMKPAYRELERIYKLLEKHNRDIQDIEFTIEDQRLFVLQTRNAKRTARAALKIACDMVNEKLISRDEAILRVTPEQIDQLLHPMLDPAAKKEVVAKGLPASPGAACGQIVFDPDTAETWVNQHKKKVILVRIETSPEDIHGMSVAEGIVTARGGMTSHAAVVARGMGKPCVSGCTSLKISYESKELVIGSRILREGDFITLEGSTGEVILGQVDTVSPAMSKDFSVFMKWVDQVRRLRVRANADTPQDAQVARNFGAEGIGLCRTEHMFFDPARIDSVREMILADSREARLAALDKIISMQREDFIGIFRAMKGLPVTVRLLDPPLHEFIPQSEVELEALSARIEIPVDRLKRRAEALHELNPMLGHRGCRLGVSFPEIYEMQVRALMEAACHLIINEKTQVFPEVMIPLVGDVKELSWLRVRCEQVLEDVVQKMFGDKQAKAPKVLIGTMIELPRAALTAAKIATQADFFSFGTNDLTQTTYGLSRDDSGIFLKDYLDAKIYESDPFAQLDDEGVGRLMRLAFEEGRAANPGLKVGICGEHGGDPSSIRLCDRYHLDYVSCSPYRVPVARLSAAQSTLTLRADSGSKATKRLKSKKK